MEKGPIKKTLSSIMTLGMIMSLLGPSIFLLEMPTTYAATFQVTNTNDSGAGSLRQAITDANTTPGADEVTFTVNGTVALLSSLPSITEQININATAPVLAGPNFIIDATGQQTGLTFTGGSGHIIKGFELKNATNHCIEISSGVTGITIGSTDAEGQMEFNNCTSTGIRSLGSGVTIINSLIGVDTANSEGINQTGGSGITIGGTSSQERNVISNNNASGIIVSDVTTLTITGNYIGTSEDGSADLGNGQSGIKIQTGCTGVTIGGDSASERNIISGNGEQGIMISSNSTVIAGNYIGTNSAGTSALANSANGILIESASNTIGGTTSDSRNLISGNTQKGITIIASSRNADGNSILNNYIGTNALGTAAIANTADAIHLSGGTIANTQIGDFSQGNLISGNIGNGIYIDTNVTGTMVTGNIIGLNASGDAKIANTLNGLSILGNNNTIGENGAGGKNTISGNTQRGIYVDGATSTVILNNYIGTSSVGTVSNDFVNGQNGIDLFNGTASSQIGGTISGDANTISSGAGKVGVSINADAGNGNSIRKNNFYGASFLQRLGTSNENISAPAITSATTSNAIGTSGTASGTIDVYQNGIWKATATAGGDGSYEVHATLTEGATLVATVTNVTNSTSGLSSGAVITADSTPPSTPTITNTALYTISTPVTLTGTKDAYSSIVINTVEVIAATDSATTWTSSQAVAEGANTFTVYSADLAGNPSGNASYSITKDSAIPTAPTLSASSTSTNSSETILGSGTEAGATVYSNGVSTGVTVDGLGSFSISVALVEGANTFSITIVDAATNTSTASAVTITKSSGGTGGGMASSGSSRHEQVTIRNNTEDEDTESIAGEEETESEIVDVPEEELEGTNQAEDNTTNNQEENPAVDESSNQIQNNTDPKPQRSFISGIYSVITPIKTPSLRDNLPAKPAKDYKLSQKLLNSRAFGEQRNGIPKQLIKIKLGNENANLEQDSDGDGLLDREEIIYGGNPYVKDSDGDGFTDLEEVYYMGTDPESADTDRDGTPDGLDANPNLYENPILNASAQEITSYIAKHQIAEPLGTIDSDQDGLCDLQELYFGTDPLTADSDADGLNDGDEYYFYGTDPTKPSTQNDAETLRVSNLRNNETVSTGEQFLMGHAKAEATVKVYEIMEDGSLNELGETVADENGKFSLTTEGKLDVGEHTIFVAIWDNGIKDISQTFTINAVDYVQEPLYVNFGIKNNSTITERAPELELQAEEEQMILVVWRSTILSQTLIADASGQIIMAKPVKNLELGDHTVTWYAINLEDNTKSAPTKLAFTVGNTAFISGDNGVSPLTVILGGIAVLSSLTALGLFLRKRNPSK